jgi:hypothetical protein
MQKIETPDLEFDVPPEWAPMPFEAGLLEVRAPPDGGSGILQVSRLPDEHLPFLTGDIDLGAFARELGSRLGGWGDSLGIKSGSCAMGRFGLSIFRGTAECPAMLLWVTAAKEAAFLWTWLGPDPGAPEVKQALEAVLLARIKGGPSPSPPAG